MSALIELAPNYSATTAKLIAKSHALLWLTACDANAGP